VWPDSSHQRRIEAVAKARGVVAEPDVDEAPVGRDVVDPVRGRADRARGGEGVVGHLDRVPVGAPGRSGPVEVADQFLLLRIHADHRLALGEEAAGGVVDVPELPVPVRSVSGCAFEDFRCCAQAVAVLPE
jgi:hypothetical protein